MNRNLYKNEEGAVIILFAALLMPMLMLTGLSIDISRANYVNTQIAYACDAAAIAAGKYNIADVQKNGLNFFHANFNQTNNDVSVTPTITISGDNKYITCSVTGTMKSYFGKLSSSLGSSFSLKTSALTTALRVSQKSEIALALDTTGSMASNNKIKGLRDAANELIKTLYPLGSPDPNISLSIVPFVAVVNIGTSHTKWLLDPTIATNPTYFTAKTPWAGCVMAADTKLVMDTDAPPSLSRLWPIYYAASTHSLTTPSAKSDNDYTYNADGSIKTYSLPVFTVGPNRSCGLPILPLTNDPVTQAALINKLVPVDGGGTMDNLGLVWAWNTISPKWKGQWGGPVDIEDYGKAVKSIVFITDGGNNWYDQSGYIPTTGDPTAYSTSLTRVSDKTLGSTKAGICSKLDCRAQLDERMLDLCTKIKAAGIQLFTIAFGKGTDATAIANLKTCATKPEWAFVAGDNTTLLANFKAIGDQIQSVVIVK